MKLVSLVNYPPNRHTQVVWRTTDALGSSNMMLSGLILVTRNRFVRVRALLAPARLISGSGVE